MKRMLWVCLLVFGLVLSWTLAYAGDFYVIPTKKKNCAPVEKTGQTVSYSTYDDGDLQKGVAWPNPRFMDNSDGTVTDNLTGLIWLKGTNYNSTTGTTGSATWADALTFCNDLHSGQCGLSDGSSAGDWRLPNVKELQSLIDFGYYSPALSDTAGTGKWTEGDSFTNVLQPSGSMRWSSSANASYTVTVWGVDFSEGFLNVLEKTNAYAVWPVRGGN
ncbi:MAG: DUF1566 domain-containing protein [Syntrophales bacterium]|nr:DUF1566 domain-containing protein [Syntrophales bacterium]